MSPGREVWGPSFRSDQTPATQNGVANLTPKSEQRDALQRLRREPAPRFPANAATPPKPISRACSAGGAPRRSCRRHAMSGCIASLAPRHSVPPQASAYISHATLTEQLRSLGWAYPTERLHTRSAHPTPARALANRRRWVRCNTRSRACTSRQFSAPNLGAENWHRRSRTCPPGSVAVPGSTSLVVVKSPALRIACSAIQRRNTEHRSPTGGVHQLPLMLESHGFLTPHDERSS